MSIAEITNYIRNYGKHIADDYAMLYNSWNCVAPSSEFEEDEMPNEVYMCDAYAMISHLYNKTVNLKQLLLRKAV